MHSLTQQGIAALRTGDKARARQLLQSALSSAPEDVDAWIWLSAALEDKSQATHCLEQALVVEPNNLTALNELLSLKTSDLPLSEKNPSKGRSSAAGKIDTRPLSVVGSEIQPAVASRIRAKSSQTTWIRVGIGGILLLAIISIYLAIFILHSLTP